MQGIEATRKPSILHPRNAPMHPHRAAFDFVGNVAADARINSFFAHTDIARLKRLLVEQICAGTGGPCSYTGRSMPEAHRGMRITDAQFDALVQDLVKAVPNFWPNIEAINNKILTGEMYNALKLARQLIAEEQELLEHARRRESVRKGR